MDRGASWAIVHGVSKELDTIEQLTYTHIKSIGKNTWSPNFHFIMLHGDNSRFKKGKKKFREKWYKEEGFIKY